MTDLSRRSFVSLLSAAALSPMAVASLGRKHNHAASNAFEWAELVPGSVWATTRSATGGNVMLVASKGEAVLIDSKFVGHAPLLRAEAESLAQARITTLINTHHHADHTGGNLLFTQGLVLAHAAAVRRIERQSDRYASQIEGARGALNELKLASNASDAAAQLDALLATKPNAQTGVFVPTQTIDRYPHVVPVGDIRVELHHFGPGHTDNDVVVVLPELGVIHTGDLVFHGLHPFCDQSGGLSLRGWNHALERIQTLCDARTRVVPGHGPLGDRGALERQRAYLDQLMIHVGEEAKNGAKKEDIMQMSWPFMDGLEFAQIRPRAIGAAYDELTQ